MRNHYRRRSPVEEPGPLRLAMYWAVVLLFVVSFVAYLWSEYTGTNPQHYREQGYEDPRQ